MPLSLSKSEASEHPFPRSVSEYSKFACADRNYLGWLSEPSTTYGSQNDFSDRLLGTSEPPG